MKNATIVKPFNFSNTEDNLMQNYDLQKYWQEDLDVEENGYTSNKDLAIDKPNQHQNEAEYNAAETLVNDQDDKQMAETNDIINTVGNNIDKSDVENNLDKSDKENYVNASGVTDIEESE